MADTLSSATQMALKSEYDVIILGGGPAGIAAAVWCSDLAVRALLIERENHLGGQMLRIFAPVRNYPGVETKNGEELRDKFLNSLSSSSCDLRLGEKSITVDLSNKAVEFESGESARACALLIATGVRRRKLGVYGEQEFESRGILSSGTKEKELVKDSRVIVVGGGDAAIENALILSDHASQVVVVHRREELSARAEFIEAANTRTNVEFRLSSKVKRFFGDGRLAGAEIESDDGAFSTIDATYALIRIGVEPNSEMFRNEVKVDPKGYIEISQYCETSSSGVYAIGDVAFPVSPTITTAVGSAATACKHLASICKKMNKSTNY